MKTLKDIEKEFNETWYCAYPKTKTWDLIVSAVKQAIEEIVPKDEENPYEETEARACWEDCRRTIKANISKFLNGGEQNGK
jgi:hypothetical protein